MKCNNNSSSSKNKASDEQKQYFSLSFHLIRLLCRLSFVRTTVTHKLVYGVWQALAHIFLYIG